MFKNLKCLLGFHSRGKRIDGPRDANIDGVTQKIIVLQCRRCPVTWTRKVKA